MPEARQVEDILDRLNQNRERYEVKYKSKKKKEDEYYDQRYGRKNSATSSDADAGTQ